MVTNYGEGGRVLRNGRGASEVLPLQKKGGGRHFLAMLKAGGHKTCLGSFNMLA